MDIVESVPVYLVRSLCICTRVYYAKHSSGTRSTLDEAM